MDSQARLQNAVLILLMSSLLMSGCGKGEPETAEPAATAAAAANTTVITQMTGLLLLVAPNQAGQATRVLLPPASNHVAWLGIGTDSSSLCARWSRGICYVDLATFSVDDIGAGGQPATAEITSFPPGLINITRASGGRRVNLATHAHLPSVTFLSGRILAEPCKLGIWAHELDGQSKEEALVNTLNWEFQLPATGNPSLVFRERSNPQLPPRTVPLVAIDGTVTLLLVNIPRAETRGLPPANPDTVPFPTASETANHLHSLYNLVDEPHNPIPNRPIPRLRTRARRHQCPVRVTSTFSGKSRQSGGIKTYGCMPAMAEGT